MNYQVIGKLSDVATLSALHPSFVSSNVITHGLGVWCEKNKKIVKKIVKAVPLVTFTLFKPAVTFAAGTAGAFGFFDGHGVILLHMLIYGFLTLLISTFLKFTGRGDLVPLVVFVGGAVILYEVIGLFNDIYNAVKTFLNE